MPRIIVTMPTRNRADLIGRAIRSLGRQTHRDFELLVGDDGCEDDTLAAVEREAMRAGVPFRIVNGGGPAVGQTAMRNRLIRETDSEFIAVLDDDDEFLPGRLAIGVRMMEADARLAVAGGAVVCRNEDAGRERVERRPTTDAGIRRHALRGSPFRHITVLMRRSHLPSQEPYDETMERSQDTLLWAEMTKRDDLRFMNTARALAVKHEHGKQAGNAAVLAGHGKVHERLVKLNAGLLARHGCPGEDGIAEWLAVWNIRSVDPGMIPDSDRVRRVYGALDRRWRRVLGSRLAAAIERRTPWHARPDLRGPPSLACRVLASRGRRVAGAVHRRLAGGGRPRSGLPEAGNAAGLRPPARRRPPS